jgi:hypothetical protein
LDRTQNVFGDDAADGTGGKVAVLAIVVSFISVLLDALKVIFDAPVITKGAIR